jgi:hypothetical protein
MMIVCRFQEVNVKRILYLFFIIAVVGPSLSGEDLNRILKGKTTDQIMMALKPTIKMDKNEILNDIDTPVEQLSDDTFVLFISTSQSVELDEKFMAFYGIVVSFTIWIYTSREYIHHLRNITGWGPTPRDALVDMIMQLAEKKVIDTGGFAEKLRSK